MKSNILIILLITLLPKVLSSQCTISQTFTNNNAAFVATDVIGQSFLPCSFAEIETVKVQAKTTMDVDIKFTIAVGEGNNTNIIYTDMVKFGNTGNVNTIFTIPIQEKLTLNLNTTYTFNLELMAGGGISISAFSGDMYNPDSNVNTTRFYKNGVGSLSGVDLYFEIEQGPEIFIPTMSQWGLLIFGLLILNLSIVTIRRRELI